MCCGCCISSNAIQEAQASPASNETIANTFNHPGIIGKLFVSAASMRVDTYDKGDTAYLSMRLLGPSSLGRQYHGVFRLVKDTT